MTRYTSRAKATIFVVVTPRDCKLTNGTAGDVTQSEKNSKRKVSDYHGSEEELWRITMHHNYAFLWVLLLVQGNDIRFYRGKIRKNWNIVHKSAIILQYFVIFLNNMYKFATEYYFATFTFYYNLWLWLYCFMRIYPHLFLTFYAKNSLWFFQ